MADERNKANRSEGLKGSPDRRKAHKDELERLDRDIKRAHDKTDPFYQTPEAEKLRAAHQNMQTAIEKMKEERARIHTEQMKLGNPLVKEHIEAIREFKDFYEGLVREDYEELTSYILDELEKPEWNDYRFLDFTLQELLDAAEQDTERTGPAVIVERARLAMRKKGMPVLPGSGNPKYFVSPISLLSNEMTNGIIGKRKTVYVPVLNIGTPSEVSILVHSDVDELFTGYDPFTRAVADAATSIYVDRINKGLLPAITPEMIYRFLFQKESSDTLSDKALSKVTEAFESSRHIWLDFDATPEFRARHKNAKIDGQKVNSLRFSGYLLQAKGIEATLENGRVKSAYLMDEPILSLYAKTVNNNIITVPATMLDIKKVKKTAAGLQIQTTSVSLNETRVIIRANLLRRVALITRDQKDAQEKLKKYEAKRRKNITTGKKALPKRDVSFFRNPKITDTILIEPVLTEAGLSNDRKHKNTLSRARKFIFDVLDYWTASGNISGCMARQNGKLVTIADARKNGRPTDAVIITHCP